MPSFFGWVGGKSRLAPVIVEHFPEHHCYVEVFGGAASVLLTKPQSPVECYNDLNSDLVNLFRQVRKNLNGFLLRTYFLMASREEYRAFQNARLSGQFESDLDRAVAFFYEIKNSFGSALGKGWAFSRKKPPNWAADRDVLEAARNRLVKVYFENRPYDRLVSLWDSSETFFYLDPPYVGTEFHYSIPFTESDHRTLARILAGLKGKFLLSYEDHPLVRTLYPENRFHILNLGPTRRPLNNRDGHTKRATELLIANYDLEEARHKKEAQLPFYLSEEKGEGSSRKKGG